MGNIKFSGVTAIKLLVVVFLCQGVASATEKLPVEPYEIGGYHAGFNEIDRYVLSGLKKESIEPAYVCSDEVFVRRIYLDLTGCLPDPEQVQRFLDNPRPDKRTTLVTTLLNSDGFADYWTLKWCDLLRVKAEFPINLWPNAVQAYHRWIYDSIRNNKPYDQFVRELLSSSGSNFRDPPANFYRAVQGREPASIAAAAALTLMGVRFEQLPKQQQTDMAVFFSRVAYKETAEWKEEIVYFSPASVPVKAVFPDGTTTTIAADKDPRLVFADWLITKDNPWFSRAIVNRAWYWMLGRGIIHEPDDIRPDNPPVYPELLDYLQTELVKSNYNLKHIFRLIAASRTYQQSSIPQSDNPKAAALFAYYPVRRLEAEVLIDALCQVTGTKESYSSPIPEPFTFIPDEHHTVELADGSISSTFLDMFGRPSRDTGLESERSNTTTETQRMHMLNSSHIQKKIQNGPRLNKMLLAGRNNPTVLTETLYLTILSRYPTDAEKQSALEYFKTQKLPMNQSAVDLCWALINSKEFLYRH